MSQGASAKAFSLVPDGVPALSVNVDPGKGHALFRVPAKCVLGGSHLVFANHFLGLEETHDHTRSHNAKVCSSGECQSTARVVVAEEHIGDGLAAVFARIEGVYDAVHLVLNPLDRHRASVHHHHDLAQEENLSSRARRVACRVVRVVMRVVSYSGCVGGDDGLDEVVLHARQRDGHAVLAFAFDGRIQSQNDNRQIWR